MYLLCLIVLFLFCCWFLYLYSFVRKRKQTKSSTSAKPNTSTTLMGSKILPNMASVSVREACSINGAATCFDPLGTTTAGAIVLEQITNKNEIKFNQFKNNNIHREFHVVEIPRVDFILYQKWIKVQQLKVYCIVFVQHQIPPGGILTKWNPRWILV